MKVKSAIELVGGDWVQGPTPDKKARVKGVARTVAGNIAVMVEVDGKEIIGEQHPENLLHVWDDKDIMAR